MARRQLFSEQLQKAEERFLSANNWFASRDTKNRLVWSLDGGKAILHKDAVILQKELTEKADTEEAQKENSIKLVEAERTVLEKAKYIEKYIENGHSCVQNEPAIQNLVKAVRYLNSIPKPKVRDGGKG